MSNKVIDILNSLKENSLMNKKSKNVDEMTANFRGRNTTEFEQGIDRLSYVLEDNMGAIINRIRDIGSFDEQEVWQGDIVTVIFSYLVGEIEDMKNDTSSLRETEDMLEDYLDDEYR